MLIQNLHQFDFISTHTPHARCDKLSYGIILILFLFLLTHLMRGVTLSNEYPNTSFGFLLTHLMRGVTNGLSALFPIIIISTHTPHARCDITSHILRFHNPISTHTPHARCDATTRTPTSWSRHFYSHTSCEV